MYPPFVYVCSSLQIFSDGDEKNFGQGLNQQGRCDRGAFIAGAIAQQPEGLEQLLNMLKVSAGSSQ
jgi:hypothetical protein